MFFITLAFLALLSLDAVFHLVLLGCVLALVVVFAQWIIGKLGLPPNIAQIVVVIVGVCALLIFLRALLPVLGVGGL
jgi:hypothetical protein